MQGEPQTLFTPEHNEDDGDELDTTGLAQSTYLGQADRIKAAWSVHLLQMSQWWFDSSQISAPAIMVHCSGLCGGALDLSNHMPSFCKTLPRTKVYGPSVAIDNREDRII